MRTLEPEDFEVAVNLMKVRGWRKGSAVGPDGEICAGRALNLAARARPGGNWCDLVRAAEVLGLGGDLVAIARWNDASSTTFREIESRFKIAAMRMRRNEGR